MSHSGEQPHPETSAFSIDLERLTAQEIVFISRAFIDRTVYLSNDYPNLEAWGHIDDRVWEFAQRDPERGRVIYEAYSKSEDRNDRQWFLETCLQQRYVNLDPEASAFGVWKHLVTDEYDHIRTTARHKLGNAFTDAENVTTDRLSELGLTLYEAGRLLAITAQYEEQLRQQKDQV